VTDHGSEREALEGLRRALDESAKIEARQRRHQTNVARRWDAELVEARRRRTTEEDA